MPETLGGAGWRSPQPDLLPLAAEALAEVLSTSPPPSAALAAAAVGRRLAELRARRVAPALRAALGPAPRGRVSAPSRVALVVQRYGAEVNGGAEQLARRIASLLRDDLDVTVLTTCALDYRTWADHYPPGETAGRGGARAPLPGGRAARRRRPSTPSRPGATPRPEDAELGGALDAARRARTCPGIAEHLRAEGAPTTRSRS